MPSPPLPGRRDPAPVNYSARTQLLLPEAHTPSMPSTLGDLDTPRSSSQLWTKAPGDQPALSTLDDELPHDDSALRTRTVELALRLRTAAEQRARS